MKTTKNSKTEQATKRAPKQEDPKSIARMLSGLARLIRYDTNDIVETRINGLWDSICQRNRAAEESMRNKIAMQEVEIRHAHSLTAQRGSELAEAQQQITTLQRRLEVSEEELANARKLHRVPQMVQLELECLRRELDKERAATRAVRAHATYTSEQLTQAVAKRSAEKDAEINAANEEIARLTAQLRVEREVYEGIMAERNARMRSAIAGSGEGSAGVPPTDGQFVVNCEEKGS